MLELPVEDRPHGGLTGKDMRRRLLVASSLGLVVVVAAAAIVVPLALPHSGAPNPTPTGTGLSELSDGPSSSALPSDSSTTWPPISTATGSTTDTSEPMWTYPPEPTPAPFVAQGWPIRWQSPTGLSSMGPDGTVYLTDTDSGPVALDASGHVRSGWLKLGDWLTLTPRAFGQDGSIYALVDEAQGSYPGNNRLYAFDSMGAPRYAIQLGEYDEILAGPSGTLYALSDTRLTILGADGSTRGTSASGDLSLCSLDNAGIGPDGTIAIFCWNPTADTGLDSAANALSVIAAMPQPPHSTGSVGSYSRSLGRETGRAGIFSPAAKLVGWSTNDWSELDMGPDGTIVATHHTTTGDDLGKLVPKDVTFAILDTGGHAAPGWPITFQGTASTPTIGSDGTVYISLAAAEGRPAQVLALGRDGHAKSGWPAALPGGTHPRPAQATLGAEVPAPPVLGRDGTVYQVVQDAKQQDSIVAFDSGGTVLPGWPVALPDPVSPFWVGACIDSGCSTYQSPLFVVAPSGTALLYVHAGNAIMAFTEDGKLAPGWPKQAAKPEGVWEYGFGWWSAAPDGGLTALEEQYWSNYSQGTTTYWRYILTRWAPDGSLVH